MPTGDGIRSPDEKGLCSRSPCFVLIPNHLFAYNKRASVFSGLVQQLDKIVGRFALTIYPYSLCILPNSKLGEIKTPFKVK